MAKLLESIFPKEDRVRRLTSKATLERLDGEREQRVRHLANQSPEAITARIRELEIEWDMERFLEMNASALALTGVGLAAAINKKWLLLPAVVLSFLLQHALHGWCPPVPIFRRFGTRTRQEIDRELYALKALRGDFKAVESSQEHSSRASVALNAAGGK